MIEPKIDDLLSRVDSKYTLVILAARRARQINGYYSQLGEGIGEFVPPMVDAGRTERRNPGARPPLVQLHVAAPRGGEQQRCVEPRRQAVEGVEDALAERHAATLAA